MQIISIKHDDLILLRQFIATMGSSAATFRYFNSRQPEIIVNHVVTLLGLDESGNPICYGHLDCENSTVWLGICVAEHHTGKGLGRNMLQALLDAGDKANIPVICLSVDIANTSAIKLYESAGFKLTKKTDKIAFFERKHPAQQIK